MKWVKQPTKGYRTPAVLALTDTEEVVYERSRQYAGDVETKGFIPEGAMPMLLRGWTPKRGRKVAERLVEAGLWRKVRGGWHFVGWEVEQADLDALSSRRTSDRERQARYRDRKRTPEHLTPLRDALDDAGIEVTWAGLTPEQVADIDAALGQHGTDRLVAAARREFRADDPARSVTAFLRTWGDLRAPRQKKPARPPWCGECDERTRMLDTTPVRRCDCAGAAA